MLQIRMTIRIRLEAEFVLQVEEDVYVDFA